MLACKQAAIYQLRGANGVPNPFIANVISSRQGCLKNILSTLRGDTYVIPMWYQKRPRKVLTFGVWHCLHLENFSQRKENIMIRHQERMDIYDRFSHLSHIIWRQILLLKGQRKVNACWWSNRWISAHVVNCERCTPWKRPLLKKQQ